MLRGTEHPSETVLQKFAAGDLSQAAREQLKKHLADCADCQAVLAAPAGAGTAPTDFSSAPTMKAPSLEPMAGQMLGEYRLIEPIGKGGMGTVYRGEQPVLRKKVAIKVMLREIAADQEGLARMVAEARAAAAVRHPNIVDVLSFGQLPDGRPYMVMEFLEGKSLFELQEALGPLSALQTLGLLDQALAALEAAHAAGVIHRDLKPENLFLRAEGKGWKLTVLDFGLALRASPDAERLTQPGHVVGTPLYMSPEQAQGLELSDRSDIYSLGAVAWSMLTAQTLFEGGTHFDVMQRHHLETPPPPSSLVQGIDPGVEALVLRMLAKKQKQRPSASEARLEIAALQAALKAPPKDPAVVARNQRRLTVGLAAGGLLLVAGLVYGFSDEPPPPEPVRPPRAAIATPPPVMPSLVAAAEDGGPAANVPVITAMSGVIPERSTTDKWLCSDIDRITGINSSITGPYYVFEVSFKHDRPLLIVKHLPLEKQKVGMRQLVAVRKAIEACKGTSKIIITEHTGGHVIWATVGGPIYPPGSRADSDDVTIVPGGKKGR